MGAPIYSDEACEGPQSMSHNETGRKQRRDEKLQGQTKFQGRGEIDFNTLSKPLMKDIPAEKRKVYATYIRLHRAKEKEASEMGNNSESIQVAASNPGGNDCDDCKDKRDSEQLNKDKVAEKRRKNAEYVRKYRAKKKEALEKKNKSDSENYNKIYLRRNNSEARERNVINLAHKRELAKERSRRYRRNKRIKKNNSYFGNELRSHRNISSSGENSSDVHNITAGAMQPNADKALENKLKKAEYNRTYRTKKKEALEKQNHSDSTNQCKRSPGRNKSDTMDENLAYKRDLSNNDYDIDVSQIESHDDSVTTQHFIHSILQLEHA